MMGAPTAKKTWHCFYNVRPGDNDERTPDTSCIGMNAGRHGRIARRKVTLSDVLARAAPGLRFNEHLDEEDGPLVFLHACKLGLEGIVSKRKDSRYNSGRSPHWINSKNPNAPAVKREAEEDWR
jgi:hypothetical protein